MGYCESAGTHDVDHAELERCLSVLHLGQLLLQCDSMYSAGFQCVSQAIYSSFGLVSNEHTKGFDELCQTLALLQHPVVESMHALSFDDVARIHKTLLLLVDVLLEFVYIFLFDAVHHFPDWLAFGNQAYHTGLFLPVRHRQVQLGQ